MKIEGKVALITGASAGIGAAFAAELARAGARISVTARSREGLDAAAPKGALTTAGDLTLAETRRRVLERTIEHFGSLDILVNNAGVGDFEPSWSIPMEDARRIMELNFFAPLEMIQLAVPHLRERGGAIVNIGSIGGKVTLPWATLYSASKSALGALTEGLRVELKRSRIHTMLVCPGFVLTGFHEHALSGRAPAAVVRARRFAITAEECAVAIRRGLERDARTILPPRAGWLLVAAARLFPAAVEARLAEINGTA